MPNSSNESNGLPQPLMETSEIEQLLCAPSTSTMTFTLSPFVSIHTTKIEQALKLIGPSTTSKILNRTDTELTHEEKIIQFFFKEFLQPFVKIHSQPVNPTEENEQSSEEDRRLLTSIIDADRRQIDESGFHDGSALDLLVPPVSACPPSVTEDTIIAEFAVSSRGSVSMDTQLHHNYTEEEIVHMLEESSNMTPSHTLKVKSETSSYVPGKVIFNC